MTVRRLRAKNGKVFVGLAAAAAMAVSAGVAFAVFPEEDVTSYAGCLNTGGGAAGTFAKVAVGDTPASPCGPNQTLVHLSGGDITAVKAGAGLTGGSTNGSATLSLAGGFALPQSCASGQVVKWNGDSWGCAADDTGPGLPRAFQTDKAFAALEFGARAPVAELALPAGNYVVMAKADVFNSSDDIFWICELLRGGSDGVRLDMTFTNTESAGVNANNSNAALSLEAVTRLDAVGKITMTCEGVPTLGADGAGSVVHHIKIIATQVAG
jgi:hypothetical protein